MPIMSHYDYWNDFVDKWFKGITQISNWTNPNSLPLLNSLNPNCGLNLDYSSFYIPEPWWGNDGTEPLHSVVINYNPGDGGYAQEKTQIKKYYHDSYAQDIVNNAKVLPDTRKWHESKRAHPILESLNRLGVINVACKTNVQCLNHHLSVELIPWHTAKASSNKNYWAYLALNIQAVYDHCICFAADMSRKIANKKLKNVVIVRMSEGDTKKLINCLSTINKTACLGNVNVTASGKGKWMEFTINGIKGVKFVSIWGSGNNFPSKPDLDEILKKI